ncbi:hypothetical protein CCHR01_17424 [Colletotrichum chrysophilum]|uniref:Uncharacterized protein n=1 Tax=Colletotrichum chrysophilum TaxID=1836956 RepID=A0AAD9A4E9_9PEZI|nr:hypothetical protein CCHR01_17424 [Colletotrichum chrysophilum]
MLSRWKEHCEGAFPVIVGGQSFILAPTRWQEPKRQQAGGKSKQQRRQDLRQEASTFPRSSPPTPTATETDRRITQTHPPQPPLNHDRLADLAHRCKSPTDSVSAACLQTLTRPGPRFSLRGYDANLLPISSADPPSQQWRTWTTNVDNRDKKTCLEHTADPGLYLSSLSLVLSQGPSNWILPLDPALREPRAIDDSHGCSSPRRSNIGFTRKFGIRPSRAFSAVATRHRRSTRHLSCTVLSPLAHSLIAVVYENGWDLGNDCFASRPMRLAQRAALAKSARYPRRVSSSLALSQGRTRSSIYRAEVDRTDVQQDACVLLPSQVPSDPSPVRDLGSVGWKDDRPVLQCSRCLQGTGDGAPFWNGPAWELHAVMRDELRGAWPTIRNLCPLMVPRIASVLDNALLQGVPGNAQVSSKSDEHLHALPTLWVAWLSRVQQTCS